MEVLRIVGRRDKDGYVAQCLELGFIAHGETEREVLDRMRDMVLDYVEEQRKHAERGQVLLARPVPYYPLKKLAFEVVWYVRSRRNRAARQAFNDYDVRYAPA